MAKNKSKKGNKGNKSNKSETPKIERNWEDLGLMMGLEIHQQLNTKHKLFCPCSTELIDDEFDDGIIRNLRPTQSELGQIDRAALQESLRDMTFKYESFNNHTCLVETDDEPPHALNREALDICITIASLLNMKMVDEFHTMRKQVIDGSNTGGFQRTGLAATDGYLDTPYGRVAIESLGLEEDAARRIDSDDEFTEFRLDRLGIPLAEITTDPSMHHPEQIKEVAYMIGQVLRSTNVKRGIGTIRQDVNISIIRGARVEIKGLQDLDLMPEIVEREVQRQLALADIKDELIKRNASVEDTIYDLDEVFKDTVTGVSDNKKSSSRCTPHRDEVRVWMLPANSKFFNLDGCLEKYGYVYWAQYYHLQKGDIVYIYSSSPDSCVKYKLIVEEHDVQYGAHYDHEEEFFVDNFLWNISLTSVQWN